jgi:sugar/nucleoside kinase (ribokinase family)
MVLHLSEFPRPGAKDRAERSELVHGGGALNAAAAVVRLGGAALLAGPMGDDGIGALLRARIRMLGIDDSLLTAAPGARTAHSAVLVLPDGERTVLNYRDAGAEGAAPGLAPFPADALLVDTRFPALSAALVAAAVAAGKPAVVDAEAPVHPCETVLRTASHVAFSEQGLRDFTGGADAAALRRAQARIGGWLCVTRGPEAVLCIDNDTVTQIPVPRVAAVNTLGAGDTWHGSFALGLARGLSGLEAARQATADASAMVARLPPWDDA